MTKLQQVIAELDALRDRLPEIDEWYIENEDFLGEEVPAVMYYDKDEVVARDLKNEFAFYITALHNGYEYLRCAALAGVELAKTIQQMNIVDENEPGHLFCEGGNASNKSWRKLRDNALSAYRSAVKK